MKKILVTTFSALLLVEIVQWSCFNDLAFSRDEAGLMQEVRHELVHPKLNIYGTIIADQGTVKLREDGTGKVYRALNVETLMEVYSQGTRSVRVEANLESSDTIQIQTLKTL